MITRRQFSTLLGAGALAAVAGPAAFAAVPDRPVTVLVPFGAGGATDLQVRILTMKAEQHLGQPAVVLNKPGASGQVGWNWMFQEGPRDGSLITAYNLPHILVQSMVRDVAYDFASITPLVNFGVDPAVLIVPTESEFQTAEQLIDYARDNPGRVTLSGGGLFGGHHVALLQFNRAAEAQAVYVPARNGGVEALGLVMGNKVTGGFNNMADAYRNQDRVRILGIVAEERHPFLPDVPTMAEVGAPMDETSANIRGFAVASDVPEEVKSFLATNLAAMVRDPEVQEQMRESGAPVVVLEGEALEAMWQARREAIASILDELKLSE